MLRRNNTADSDRTFLSPTSTSPCWGSISRLKQRRSVVFPDPLSPTSAVACPAAASRLTFSRATTLPKRCDTFRALSVVGMLLRVHPTPHRVDDDEIDQRQSHEHQLRNTKEAMHPAPAHQLTNPNEDRRPLRRLAHGSPHQIVDESRDKTCDSSGKYDSQRTFGRKDEQRSMFQVRDDAHQYPPTNAEYDEPD